MDLEQILLQASKTAPDSVAMRAAYDHWNSIAKPIGGLGVLEDAVIQLAGIQSSEHVCINKRAVAAFCADNGVVAEGVTQTGQETTAIVAGNMAKGMSSVCCMAKTANIDVFPVDVGMLTEVPGVLDRSVARGTNNMAHGPAMTREQVCCAVKSGADIARELVDDGYNLLISGEMGIGNTTTSSAVAAVLLGLSPAEVTGRGAGLSSAGLARKVAAIEQAIEVNKPKPDDVLDVLAKVGGFDLAAMTGLFIGGCAYRVPVLIDGFISAVAALAAARLCPECVPFMMPTHASAEPAFCKVMDALGFDPIIHAEMHLGEGTGAVCMVPMLDMALALYGQGDSFDSIGIDAYEVDLA